MPVAPIPEPHSYEFYGMPWATREERFRPQPSSPSPVSIPPVMRGQFGGTPAYDAGAPPPGPPGGTLPLPAPYNWDGTSAVPNELYAMAVDLASAFSSSTQPIPPQSDAPKFELWLTYLYQALTAKGEGCGIDPDDLERTIIKHAGEGPHAVAYYLQEAALASDVCAKYLIKNPLSPPVPPAVTREVPGGGTFVTTKLVPPGTSTGPKKPFRWGWTLGGVSAALAVGVGLYFLYKGNKRKRRNPCACNPTMALAIESDEPEENPYGGSRAFSSIDSSVVNQSLSPLLRNPGSKKRKPRRRSR